MSDHFPQDRVYDLLRYARHFLFDAELISRAELDELILSPSSSARRLESYDEMRAEISALREVVRCLCRYHPNVRHIEMPQTADDARRHALEGR